MLKFNPPRHGRRADHLSLPHQLVPGVREVDGFVGRHRGPVGAVVGGDPVVHPVANGCCRPADAGVDRKHVLNRGGHGAIPRRGAGCGDGLVGPARAELAVVEGLAAPGRVTAVHGDKTGSVPLEAVAKAGNLTDTRLGHQGGGGTADGPRFQGVTVVVVAVLLATHVEGVALNLKPTNHLARRAAFPR